MFFLKRFERGELRLNRLEAFSDGVFAIIVTLLVLDLKIPSLTDPQSSRELADRLLELLPKLLSWAISFIIVCKFWLNHHHIVGLARHADYGMIWLNCIFLMFQSFIPFPTALMGEHPSNRLAVSLFGVVMAFNTVLFVLLQAHILRRLIRPELAAGEDPHIIRKSLVGPVCYLAGTAMAWINIPAAFAIYLLTPLLFIVPPGSGRD